MRPSSAAAASAAAVTVAELVTAPTYEWEGDDDDGEGEDEAEAEDGPVRFRPLTELTVTACLWQQRWCWRTVAVQPDPSWEGDGSAAIEGQVPRHRADVVHCFVARSPSNALAKRRR